MITVLGEQRYASPFLDMGVISLDSDDVKDSRVVVFTGGHDVWPRVYGEEPLPETHFDRERDDREIEIYKECVEKEIHMVGICRGAQFLNVMNGGGLIQHVTGHALHGTHTISTRTGIDILVTSTHHQMLRLPDSGARLLAWANGLSDRYLSDSEFIHDPNCGIIVGSHKYREPEVVWYKKTKSLCVQYHPEYMSRDSEGWEYFQQLLNQYIN